MLDPSLWQFMSELLIIVILALGALFFAVLGWWIGVWMEYLAEEDHRPPWKKERDE